jgi:hypothetical protein
MLHNSDIPPKLILQSDVECLAFEKVMEKYEHEKALVE